MKYIGAIYILWLAIHIALSKAGTENAGKSASFMKGFMLQFINIKIYMFGITAMTGYVIAYSKSFIMLFVFGVIIATIGTIATITWIGMGIIIQKVYLRHYRIINIVLAIILLESAYSMVKWHKIPQTKRHRGYVTEKGRLERHSFCPLEPCRVCGADRKKIALNQAAQDFLKNWIYVFIFA